MTAITATARTLGTAFAYSRIAARAIDWAEVQQIVTQGLQVLIAMTLLAGRYTRRAWDALPALSERLGAAYARLLVGSPQTPPAPAFPAPLAPAPAAPTIRSLHAAGLSQRAIAAQLGITRHAVRKELAAM